MDNIITINNGGFEKAFHDYHGYVKKLKDIGFNGLDVSLCDDWNKVSAKFQSSEYKIWASNFKAFCDKNGMVINQTHALFPLDRFEEAFIISEYSKEIEATSLLGAKYIVFHPGLFSITKEGKKENFIKNVNIFKKLSPILKQYNVIGCIETLWEFNNKGKIVKTNLSFPKELIDFVDEIGTDTYGICLDTGHLNLLNYPLDKAIREFGDYLKVLHINDNEACGDTHLAPTLGTIDWKPVLKALKDIGYKGSFNMELSIYNKVGKYEPSLVYDYAAFSFKIAKTLLEMEGNN